jgi:hypothetical protein
VQACNGTASGDTFVNHRGAWEDWLEDESQGKKFRVGILVPNTSAGCVKPSGTRWPKDSHRDEINYLITGSNTNSPRLTASDIIELANAIYTQPNTDCIPKVIRFVRDNSGSLTNSMYQTQYEQARFFLQNFFPNMVVQEQNGLGEQWMADTKSAAIAIINSGV